MGNEISLAPEIRQSLSQLCAHRRKGYGEELPSEVDQTFLKLADCYSQTSAEKRYAVREAVPDDLRLLLIGFSDRFSILAERGRQKQYLRTALLAHSIEDFRWDERENIFRLALVDHVAKKLGEDVETLFQDISSLSSPRSAARFRRYRSRKPELRTLKAMGIVEVNTEEGVDYRYR